MKRSGFESAITVILFLLVIIGFATLSIVGLTGCSNGDFEPIKAGDDFEPIKVNNYGLDISDDTDYHFTGEHTPNETYVTVITDNATGVQYIVYAQWTGWNVHGGAISGICPRYNIDGTLYVDPEWNGKTGTEGE